MSDKALIIFAKAPIKGFVKTRLSPSLSETEILRLYRFLLERTVKELRASREYETIIAYTPASEEKFFRSFGLQRFPQCEGDLGQKLMDAFERAFKMGYRSVAVVGVDIPELKRELVEEAFKRLSRYDVVLGPASDGGYYLLGLNALVDIFSGVRWSTPWTFEDTVQAVKKTGLKVSFLKTLRDIDTVEDLMYFRRLGIFVGG